MQGTWVRSLVQVDPTCQEATKPDTATEDCVPRTCTLQHEGPPQCEANSLQLEKAMHSNEDPAKKEKLKKR